MKNVIVFICIIALSMLCSNYALGQVSPLGFVIQTWIVSEGVSGPTWESTLFPTGTGVEAPFNTASYDRSGTFSAFNKGGTRYSSVKGNSGTFYAGCGTQAVGDCWRIGILIPPELWMNWYHLLLFKGETIFFDGNICTESALSWDFPVMPITLNQWQTQGICGVVTQIPNPYQETPEPSTIAGLLSGCVGLIGLGIRRRK